MEVCLNVSEPAYKSNKTLNLQIQNMVQTGKDKEYILEQRKRNIIDSIIIKVAGDYATLHGDI